MDSILDLLKLYRGTLKKSIDTCIFNNLCTEIDKWFSQLIDIDANVAKTGKSTSEILDSCFSFFLMIADVVTGFLMEGCDMKQLGINVLLNIISNLLLYEPIAINKASSYVKLEHHVILNYEKLEQFVNKFMPLFPLMIVAKDDININSLSHPYIWYNIGRSYFVPELHIIHPPVAWSKVSFEDSIQYVASYTTYVDLAVYKYIKNRGSFSLEIVKWLSIFFENYLIKLNVVCSAIECFLELDLDDKMVNPMWHQQFSDQTNVTTLKRKSAIQKNPKISISHSLFGTPTSKNWLQSQSFREPDPHYNLRDEKSDNVNSSLDLNYAKLSPSPPDSLQQQAMLKDHINSIQKSVIIRKVTSEQYLDIQHSVVLSEETTVILSACQDLLDSWGMIKLSRMLNIFSDILLVTGNSDFASSTLNLLIISLKITKILKDISYKNNRYSLSSIMFYEEGLEENLDDTFLAQFCCLSTLLCFIGCQDCKKRVTINQGIFLSQKSDLNLDHNRICILRKIANDVIENLDGVSISSIRNYLDRQENYLMYFASLHSLFGCQHMYQIIHARHEHLNLTYHDVISANSHRILEEMVLPPLFMKIFSTPRIFGLPRMEEFYIFWNYSLLHYRLASTSLLFAFFSEKIERPCSIQRLKHYIEKPELNVEFRFDDVFEDNELVKRIIRLRVIFYCSFHALVLKSSEILLLLSMNASRDMICLFLYEYCYFLSQSNCGVPTPLIKCLEISKVWNNETCSFINFNLITYRSLIPQTLIPNFYNFETLINDLFNKSESKYWIIGAVCCLICKILTMSMSLSNTQKMKSSSENVSSSMFLDIDAVCDSFSKFIFNSNDKLEIGIPIDQQECLNTNSLKPSPSYSSHSLSFRKIGSFREDNRAYNIFRIFSTWCKIAFSIFPIIVSRDLNNDGSFVKKSWNDCVNQFTKFLGKLWSFYDSEKLYHFPMWKTAVISSLQSYDDLRNFIWTQSSSITLLIVECFVRLSPYLPEDCVEVYFTMFWHLAFHKDGLIATYASIGVLILNQLFPRICDYQLNFILKKSKTCSDLSYKINSINHIWSSRFLVYAIFDRNIIKEYTSRAIFPLQTPLVGISYETFLTLDAAWNDSVVPSSGLSNSLQEDLKWKENKDFSLQSHSKFEKQSSYLRIKTNISENSKILEVSANSLCWKRRSRHCYTKVVPADCIEGCYLPKISSQIVRYVYNVIVSSPVSNPSQLLVAKCFNSSIQNMLIDDPALALRCWFEKDLKSSDEIFVEIYRLLKCLLIIPFNMSIYLFNAIVAYAKHFMSDMSCISTSFSGVVLHILNIVMPRIQNITFSEFRNSLWTASCETSFLITAHAQSLKNVFLKHGEVTKKVLLSEACTFENLRNYCLKYFGDENIHTTNNIVLIDEKSKKVLDPRLEIMAFYYHKPSASRTVILVYFISDFTVYHGNVLKNISDEVNNTWERFIMLSSVENFSNDETQALQVYSELITKENLISSFTIYTYGLGDSHLLHPVVNVVNTGLTLSCIRFFSSLLREIQDLFSWGDEIRYFLDIYNVTLLMCPDNSLLLRTWIAAILDLSIIMKDTFSLKGFTFILPTMLRVYSNSNQSTNEAIEFCHSKMFLLHEKNYIYQFFSCIAPSVQNSICYSNVNPALKIPEESVINLLFSLEKSISDNLKVLDVMKSSKPLYPLDPATSDQFGRTKIEYCIQLAVMAISYKSSRNQCLSMLIILHAILPAYVDHFVERNSDFTTKEVFDVINYLQTIISSCSFLKNDVEAMSKATSNRKETKMNVLDKISSTVRSVRKSAASMSVASANYIRGFIGPLINPQPSEVQQAIQNSLVCCNAILSLSAKVVAAIKKKCNSCDFHSILTSENLNCLLDMAVGIVNVGTKYYEVIDMIGLKSFLRYILPCIQINEVHSHKINSLIEIIDTVFQSLVSYPDLVGKTDNNILAKFLCDLSFGINENHDLCRSSCLVNLMISISKVISFQYASYDESYKHCSLEICSYAVELASYMIGYSTSSFQFSHIFVLSLEESTPDYVLDCLLVFWFLPLLIQLAPNIASSHKPSLKSSCVPFVLTIFNILLNQLIFQKTGKTKSQINHSFHYNVQTYTLPSLQGLPSKFLVSKVFESLLSLGFKILLTLHSNNLKNFWTCISSFLSDFIMFGQVDQVCWDLIEFILSSHNPLLLSLSHTIIKLKYLSEPSISNKIPEQIVDLACPSGQSGLLSRSPSDTFVILHRQLKTHQEQIHHNLVSRNHNSY